MPLPALYNLVLYVNQAEQGEENCLQLQLICPFVSSHSKNLSGLNVWIMSATFPLSMWSMCSRPDYKIYKAPKPVWNHTPCAGTSPDSFTGEFQKEHKLIKNFFTLWQLPYSQPHHSNHCTWLHTFPPHWQRNERIMLSMLLEGIGQLFQRWTVAWRECWSQMHQKQHSLTS